MRTEDLLARIGGDEFVVVMRQSTEDSPESLANRIIEVVSAPITLSTGDKVSIGISVGIASY